MTRAWVEYLTKNYLLKNVRKGEDEKKKLQIKQKEQKI